MKSFLSIDPGKNCTGWLLGFAFAAVFAPSILSERATWERVALDRVSRSAETKEPKT